MSLRAATDGSSPATHHSIQVSDAYQYTPITGILIAAIAVFSVETIILAVQAVRSRVWFLLWLVLFCAAEAGGYIAFVIFVKSPSLPSYLAELIILILAPNLVTLVNYTVIGLIARHAKFNDGSVLTRHAMWIPIFFCSSDLVCLAIQGIGGSQLSQSQTGNSFNQSQFNVGRTLTLAGIGAQLGFQSIFTALAIFVFCTMPDRTLRARLRWAWLCMALTMLLVSIRNIYRIIEFAGGRNSSIDRTEAPYDVLDLLMMAVCAAVFIVLDLGSDRVLPRFISKPTQAEKDVYGSTEIASAGYNAPQAMV